MTLGVSCGGNPEEHAGGASLPGLPDYISHDILKEKLKKYASVEMRYDESILSEPEKQALEKLVQAAHIMDEIFLRQVWSGNVAMRETLRSTLAQAGEESSNGDESVNQLKDLNRFFRINFGPWDRIEENTPFIGTTAKPAGANYYPEDITKEEFEAHVATHPKQAEAFRGYFTTIRRQDGVLSAVPYSVEYKRLLESAAVLLHEAVDILTNPDNEAGFAEGVDYATLARFLRSRADAFSSNDYYQSDMNWMDVTDNIIDVTIGPYEVYEDRLFGYKAAYEAFIAIRHPEDSKKLEGLKRYLQALENNLPIPDEHKNPNRGSESPISVVDLVYVAGDTKAGVQTIAFNLPNDERVREAKGSKKVMLKNISKAKFDKILVPIAKKLLDPEQMEHVDFETYFNNVLMHEMAHGLGPGNIITSDGRETTAGRELKDLYSAIEEAKADVVGLHCTRLLVSEGFLPKGLDRRGYVTFLPGFFRAIRFGATAAHGKANMVEFNFMREQGAIVFDSKKKRYHVDIDKMPAAVEALSNRLLMIEATGDYEAAKAFLETYSQTPPEFGDLLKKLERIPVDIEPVYPAEALIKSS
jgi:hypothetical protein